MNPILGGKVNLQFFPLCLWLCRDVQYSWKSFPSGVIHEMMWGRAAIILAGKQGC